jgi:hypothetical protein
MGWFVHYWNEIDNRNVCTSEMSAREDAMRKACSLMREGHVVSHVAGPNGERIDIVDIRTWCLRMQATSLAHAIRPPLPAALDDQRRMLCFNYGTAQWGASGGAVSLDGAVT